MKPIGVCLALLMTLVVSCKKYPTYPPPPSGETGPDTVTVRLKDIVINHLPSPWYHFAYNDSGYITNASFSSGLGIYNFTYAGGKIQTVQNNILVNHDKLEYEYEDGLLKRINIKSEAGVLVNRYVFFYSGGRLSKLDWYRLFGTDFLLERTQQFTYYTDGNLKDLQSHYWPVAGQPETVFNDRYENYDNKTNVDGFLLMNFDQFHHPVMVPKLQLQRNNPARETRTGNGANYTADYAYIYDAAGRPLQKNGDLVFTSGTDMGKHFALQTTFSYYP